MATASACRIGVEHKINLYLIGGEVCSEEEGQEVEGAAITEGADGAGVSGSLDGELAEECEVRCAVFKPFYSCSGRG